MIDTFRNLLLGLLLPLVLAAPLRAQDYDVIIHGGTVIDGSGSPGFRADVAIKGGRIAMISTEPIEGPGAKRVDASGLVVTPGFIDMHAHLDPITKLPEAQSMVRQGVTTAVGGPDGGGPWPIGPYLSQLEQQGVGLNVCMLVGHNSVRQKVMKLDDRAPMDEELSQMRQMVAQAMEEGAWGISTGLKYLPGSFADINEIVALSKEVSARDGFYTSHLREEGLGLIDAVTEAIEIGRQAKIPIVLTHHKVVGQPMWGKSRETLAMVDAAREEGLDIMMDQYPYTATYTGITVLVPAWARAFGTKRFLQRLEDPETRERIKKEIIFNLENDRGGGDLRRVQFGLVEWDRDLEGKTLHDWAVMKGLKPTSENGAELVIEAIRNGGASCIYHVLDEKDVERIMRHPMTMVGSDGRLTEPGNGHPHPRWYGAFPRVLGHYVREKNILKLEQAVHKMTSLSAKRIGLENRGLVAEGYFADLVIFDPETIIDKATFKKPHQYPVGIHHVFVNGEAAVADGKFQNLRAGRVLRRSDFSAGEVFPGKEWERWKTPKEAGWSAKKLQAVRAFSEELNTSAMMIVDRGRILDEWGETERPFKCHSMRKSILSALYGPHVELGTIDLNADLASLGIDDNAPSLTVDEKKATIGDLLKARSGIFHPALYETAAMAAARPERGSHPPGTFWYYNNWDFNALGTLFENLTGRSLFEEFEDRLAGPLGMQDFDRKKHTEYFSGSDSVHPAYPFRLSARDMARFGLLFARGGNWNHRQVIPEGWVIESTRSYSTTDNKGGYGYMWWVATEEAFLPGVEIPKGAFSARGYRGHKLLVIPQWDLVIVHRVNTFEKEGSVSSAEFGKLVRLILEARAPSSTAAVAAAATFDQKSVEAQVPALMEEFHVPGVSIAVVKDNQIAWTKTWGVKRAGTDDLIDDGTLFEAASMSKPLFAYAVLKLVEQDKLDLDRPLVDYLDKPYLDDQPDHKLITARMVLTHTTGFPNWRKDGWKNGGPLPVNFKPGTGFGYSGEGFLYLQRVVEQLTGEPLTDFMNRVLIKNIGMEDSSFEFEEAREQAYSAGHDNDGEFKTDRAFYREGNAAFSLYATPSDYARSLIEIMKRDRTSSHSLSKESIEALLTPTVKATGRHDGWRGLGWQIHETNSGKRISHGGSNGTGFRCHSRFYPDQNTGIVIMTNSYGGEKLWKKLMEDVDP